MTEPQFRVFPGAQLVRGQVDHLQPAWSTAAQIVQGYQFVVACIEPLTQFEMRQFTTPSPETAQAETLELGRDRWNLSKVHPSTELLEPFAALDVMGTGPTGRCSISPKRNDLGKGIGMMSCSKAHDITPIDCAVNPSAGPSIFHRNTRVLLQVFQETLAWHTKSLALLPSH